MTRTHRVPTYLRGLLALSALFLFASSCAIEALPTPNSELDASTATTDTAADEATDKDGAADESVAADGDDQPADAVGDDTESAPALDDDFTVADPGQFASVESEDCDDFFELTGPPEGTDPECYTISVPENWSTPDDGEQVHLPVSVFRALDGDNDDAVIYLEGGPGGNSIESTPFSYGTLLAPFHASRDVVVFDQRGAGLSRPVLDCPEADEAVIDSYEQALSVDDEEQLFLDAMIDCRDRLTERGVDLDVYHSVFSAIDTEAIRRALDFAPWNVLGISYGTRLGQTLLRMYPDAVRSIVLDSVVPVTANMTPDFAPNAARAFEQLFAGCEADDACTEAYPNFRSDYFELVDRLDAEPAEFDATNSLSGDSYELVASGDDLLDITFGALYSPATFAIMPELVADGLDGNYDLIGELVSLELTNSAFLSIGMLVSVRCHEEEPFEDVDDIEAREPDDGYYARFAVNDLAPLCDVWPAGTASAVENELVTSETPTLLMAGEYDPITPPSGLPVIAEGLSSSWSVVFPHLGHGVAPSPCGSDIVTQFFDDPETEPNSSCIEGTVTPAFTPRADESITMIPFESSLLGPSTSGLRPEEWEAQGFGVFARGSTIADPALLLVQPSGGLPPTFVLTFLEDALGWPGQPDETGELTTDVGTWSIYEAEFEEQSIAIAFLAGDTDVFVALGAYPDEYTQLYDEVFVPALEGLQG